MIFLVYLQVIPSDVGSSLPWNYAFKRSYWRRHEGKQEGLELPEEMQTMVVDSSIAVAIGKLSKIFETTDGGHKVAVNSLDLDVASNEITGLLGAIHHLQFDKVIGYSSL